MIPEVIFLPHSPMPFAPAISRLTSVTGVLALCILGALKPRTWHLAGLAICAVIFFVWTYQDTERPPKRPALRAARYLDRNSSPGLALSPCQPQPGSCLYCEMLAYGNYEPSITQFCTRVHHGSPLVTDLVEDHLEMQSGFYTVRKEDLPMNQIYQSDEKNLAKLCIRELSEGEQNGSVGYRLPRRL